MFCTYPNWSFQQEPLQSEVLCLCPAQSGPAPLCINQVILMTQTPPWSEVLMLVGMKGSDGRWREQELPVCAATGAWQQSLPCLQPGHAGNKTQE